MNSLDNDKSPAGHRCKGESRTRQSRAGRPGVRRRVRAWVLETLEDRVVLSTITVTNTDDSGLGSLRAAIIEANGDHSQDTIVFAPAVTGTISLANGLTLSGSIDIAGPGAGTLIVARSSAPETPNFGVFDVQAGAIVTISGLTITGGATVGADGGGIASAGTLVINGDTISGNSVAGIPSAGAKGGGIYNTGTLTVSDATISGNSIAGGMTGGGWGLGSLTPAR